MLSIECFCVLSALILEEIAIDCQDKKEEGKILQEAQELHLSSLELARYFNSYMYITGIPNEPKI